MESAALKEALWAADERIVLVRVAHVLQLEVHSIDPRMSGKFLLNTWTQMPNGSTRTVNRMLAAKLSMTKGEIPYDGEKFERYAENAVHEQLAYLVDMHFQIDAERPPTKDDADMSGVQVLRSQFKDHRNEVEESPSYPGLWTMYHLYTMEVDCTGLPVANFASLDFRTENQSRKSKLKYAHGWTWVSWPQALETVNARKSDLERERKGMQATRET